MNINVKSITVGAQRAVPDKNSDNSERRGEWRFARMSIETIDPQKLTITGEN